MEPVVTGDESGPRAIPALAALLLAPLAWAAHLLVGVALVPAVCETGALWPFHLATVVTALVALGGVGLSLRERRAERSPRFGPRERFVGDVGLVVSLLFLALIVAEGLPALWVDACL